MSKATFVKNNRNLFKNALGIDIAWLANELSAPCVGILTEEDRNKITDQRLMSDSEKKELLVERLVRALELNENESLGSTLGILEKRRRQFGTAIKLLKKKEHKSLLESQGSPVFRQDSEPAEEVAVDVTRSQQKIKALQKEPARSITTNSRHVSSKSTDSAISISSPISPVFSEAFPYENTDNGVKEHIRNLAANFFELVKQLRKELDVKKMGGRDIGETLLDLPQPLHLIYSSVLEEKVLSVMDHDDVSLLRMFFKLKECWNFLDIEILQCVIEEHGSDILKAKMRSYQHNLQLFCEETTVHQLKESHELLYKPEAVPKGYRTLVQKLGIDPKKCSIQTLESIRKETRYCVQGAPLSVTALILCEVFCSSVVLVWLVEEKEANRLLDGIQQQVATNNWEFIERYNVELLLFDDYILYPCDFFQNFWNACRQGRVDVVTECLVQEIIDPNIKILGCSALMCAAKHQNMRILELLVSLGATIDAQDNMGRTALTIASLAGDLEVAQFLLQNEANPFIKDNFQGMCPFLIAAERNDVRMLELFLGKCTSADLNLSNEYEKTALSLTIENNNLECFAVLLQEDKVDIQHYDKMGRTALHMAANSGNVDLVKKVLAKFVADARDIVILKDKEEFTAEQKKVQKILEDILMSSAKEGDVLTLERLLLLGIDPNIRETDEEGFCWTPLLWACNEGHSEIVDKLIEFGADVHEEDSKGWTGLHLSSRNGFLLIAEKLLNSGADINKCNKNLWSALMWAAHQGHTEVVKLLLQRGAETNTKDENGFTPFLQACQDGKLEVVQLLVEHDEELDLDQKTKASWSAIMLAVKNGHEELVRYLVQQGCDVQYQREEDMITALHIASYKGYNSIVRYLCLSVEGKKERLEANVKDYSGVTPLMYAAKKGHLDVVKTLVTNGRANVQDTEEDSEWTALFFAVEGRHNKVVEYLLNFTKEGDMCHEDKFKYTVVDFALEMNPEAHKLFLERYKTQTKKLEEQAAGKPKIDRSNYAFTLSRIDQEQIGKDFIRKEVAVA